MMKRGRATAESEEHVALAARYGNHSNLITCPVSAPERTGAGTNGPIALRHIRQRRQHAPRAP